MRLRSNKTINDTAALFDSLNTSVSSSQYISESETDTENSDMDEELKMLVEDQQISIASIREVRTPRNQKGLFQSSILSSIHESLYSDESELEDPDYSPELENSNKKKQVN